jgi:hypothetical protein
VTPPYAASGANTGIADAHNLAWKLAAVRRGDAADALLDSYQAERRPAGWFAADQSARRTTDLRAPVTEFAPAGRVGTRVPHRWLDPGRRRSTIDLAGPGWATLTGRPDWDFLPEGDVLLLRPDHVVAWRGRDVAAASRVRAALLQGLPVAPEAGTLSQMNARAVPGRPGRGAMVTLGPLLGAQSYLWVPGGRVNGAAGAGGPWLDGWRGRVG